MSEESRKIRLIKSANADECDTEASRGSRFSTDSEANNQSPDRSALRLSNMGKQADILQNLINELKSMSAPAADALMREAGGAERTDESKQTELAQLKFRLKEKEDAFEARELALGELEEASKAKFAAVEGQIEERKNQLDRRERELARLTAKVHGVINRLNQTESEAQSTAQRLEAELTELRHQLAEKDESLAAKNLQWEKLEGELRENIKELELQLQTTAEKLQSSEAELTEKESLIQSAAVKESEIGKLITRLSAECDRLSSELDHKNMTGAQTEKKESSSVNDARVWKKILGRIQD
jgi:chromosome segregation ATPase